MEGPTLKKWNNMIHDDIQTMKDMLDRIEELMAKHINGQEKFQYIQPVKQMIWECYSDLVHNGISFTEYNENSNK